MNKNLWCLFKNMWCTDTDEEDHQDMNCDGDCRVCIFSEEYEKSEEN